MISIKVDNQSGVVVNVAEVQVIDTPVLESKPVEIDISSTIAIVETPADVEHYDGTYEVTPKAHDEQILDTFHKYMDSNVIVHKVPYFQVSNTTGKTVFIASEV